MRKLSECQKNFILEYFFKNKEYAGWKNIATKLLDDGKCIVAGKSCIWIGGIGNFIKTTEAADCFGWLKCDDCRELLEIEKYNNFEFKEYDGSLVYSHLLDMYFNDSEEIEDYCLDEDIEHKDLRLVYCDPIYFREVETDYWSDNLPDDNDEYIIPNELQTALDNLNKVISGLPPISYYPGKIRTEYIVI